MGRGTHHGGPGGGLKPKDPGRRAGADERLSPAISASQDSALQSPRRSSRPAGLCLVLALGVFGSLDSYR